MTGRNPYYHGPPSDHFNGTRFFNPGGEASDRGLRDILRWRLTSRPARWPKSVPARTVRPDPRVDGLRITMVGHATLLIQAAGLNILTDPVWSERASPFQRFGPKRVTAQGIDLDALPPIDAILLSHNHYDHLDLASLARLVAVHDPLIVTPLGNGVIVRRAIPRARFAVGDWNDRFELAPGTAVTLVRANHWSARGLRDRRMALWCGFMLQTPAGLVHFAGDTGYGGGGIFREMRAQHGAPDVALLPIGAYAPRWFMAPQHANPDEAVQILLDLEAKRGIGIHWGTFQLTDEAREEPVECLARALQDRGIDQSRFPSARPGDVFDIEG